MFLNNTADKLVFNFLNKINYGYLELTTYDGKVLKFGNPNEKLYANILIKKPDFNYNLIRGGSIGFAESYMRGEFETDNLSNLIELTARNIDIIYKFSGLLDFPIINFVKNRIIKNTKSRSKENIAKHYDLGNDFFSNWLDKTLTYSSAIYEKKDDNLETAQKNKYQKLINLLNPKNGDKVLEIGCGWGGFSEYLAKRYDVIIDCITISKKQYEYTKKRIFKNGLNNKVNVMFLDYRDLKDEYDKIASIEMIEAVGEKYLDQYFRKIKNSLKSNGHAAIQGITIRDDLFDRYRTGEDFIQKYIFPGGFLPSSDYIKRLAEKNKLKLEKINSYSNDYAKTLSTWRNNFFKAWNDISPLGFDDSFKRMWEFYLSYCEAGFKAKNIDLIQFSMSNR